MQVQRCLVEDHLQKTQEYLWACTGSKTTPGEVAEFEAQSQEETSSSAVSPARCRTHCHGPAQGCRRELCRLHGHDRAERTLNYAKCHALHSRSRGTAHAARPRPSKACITISFEEELYHPRNLSTSFRDNLSILRAARFGTVTRCPWWGRASF